jgi:TolB protein
MKFLWYTILGIALLFSNQARANGSEDAIFVQLETEISLFPLYMTKFSSEKSAFDSAYVDQLEDILRFDFSYNGTTHLLPRSQEHDAALANISKNSKLLRAHYVVLVKIDEKKLSARLYSLSNNTWKSIEDLDLTGTLSRDRKQIHLLADTIHKVLFQKEGVASTRILYSLKEREDKKFTSSIWEADYDGANRRKVTGEGYCISPVYVPPKKGVSSGSLFYVSYLNGQPKIYYASLKDGVGHRLTSLRGNQLMPTISRQRDQVAFICDAAGNPDLFIQNFSPEEGLQEKPRQIFTSKQGVQGSPAFSPDGNRIAFVSNKDGSARLYVMDIPPPGARLQDLRPKLISKQCRENTAPAWSPDGTKLAYCAMIDKVRQIWIYDFEIGRERQLTQGPGHKENPAWAPNSLHLIFNTTGTENELYLVNLNQPQAKKISSGKGEKHYPSWEPKIQY